MEKWEKYLTDIDIKTNNIERMSSVKETENITYKQVLKSLELLEEERQRILKEHTSNVSYIKKHYVNGNPTLGIANYLLNIVKEVLQWMDVAKAKGILVGHNSISSAIYEANTKESSIHRDIVSLLIASHGLIGQTVRGEVKFDASAKYFREILDLNLLSYNELRFVVEELNYCIIAAVDPKIYDDNRESISYVIAKNMEKNPTSSGMRMEAYNNTNRFLRLMGNKNPDGVIVKPNDNNYGERLDTRVLTFLKTFNVWYFQPALEHFSFEDVAKLLDCIMEICKHWQDGNYGYLPNNVSFKDMADTIYYDYHGKKHLNIYKVRLLEHLIHNNFISEHVIMSVDIRPEDDEVRVSFDFTDSAESLLSFCMQAEISNSSSYNKCIRILYDALGLRKDEYDRLNNEDDYIDTMNDSTDKSTKRLILENIPEDAKSIADIGPGGGELINKIIDHDKYHYTSIDGYEISKVMRDKLTNKFGFEPYVSIYEDNIVYGVLPNKYDVIIFSSILHEIFSYTDYEPGKKFYIETVELALVNAYKSLNKNGRIIIRDGIKCDDDKVILHMTKDCMLAFINYCNDFKGNTTKTAEHLMETSDKNYPYCVTINKDYAREFMYTYTWGPESYTNEVQEQFGYYTLQEYKDTLEDIGFSIEKITSVLEPGYEEHLKDNCYISDINGNKLPYPDSNCFIVATKEE